MKTSIKPDELKEVAIMRVLMLTMVLSTLLLNGLFAGHTNAEPMPNIDGSMAQQIRIKAEQGYAEAQNNLGVVYASGKGVTQDDEQAAFWFRKAADQGEAMAQFTSVGCISTE
jgi:hypothetical protein